MILVLFFNNLATLLKKLYREHEHLLEKLKPYEKESFNKYLNGDTKEISLSWSLLFLSEMLYKYSNQKRIFILIDEYDTPPSNF